MLEHQAFYGAIELLLPSKYCSQTLYAMAKENSTRTIAEHFIVPEKIIKFRLSETSQAIFDKFKEGVK